MDAGTDSGLNLTVNIDGEDVADTDFDSDLEDSEALLFDPILDTPFDRSKPPA